MSLDDISIPGCDVGGGAEDGVRGGRAGNDIAWNMTRWYDRGIAPR